jgi:phosphoglycerate dehydrogenase-like enzyme
MRRVRILLVCINNVPRIWGDAVLEAFGDRHDLRVFDESKPLAEQFKDIEMVIDIGGWSTREMIDAATDVKLWQVQATGLDHTNTEYMMHKGIAVANCPGQLGRSAMAECAMLLILNLARKYHECMANLRTGILWLPFGRSLNGLTLGLIGFGASAQELARRAKPFGMRIEAIEVRRIEEEMLHELRPDFMGGPEDMDKVIARSDILSLHLPLTKQTRHIIDARRLALMKPDAYLINIARGDLVDEQAMHTALLAGRLGGVGLDVFSEEPVDMTKPFYYSPKVVITPHIAACTDETARGRAGVALENACRLAQRKELINLVTGTELA